MNTREGKFADQVEDDDDHRERGAASERNQSATPVNATNNPQNIYAMTDSREVDRTIALARAVPVA